ncbi:MAG: hypothetical protein AAFP85_03165 [Pseudomonadota bacterium]
MRTERDAPLQLDQEVPGGFVYENEHPQLQLAFSAHIGDRRMEGKSLSVTKACVSGLLAPAANWKRQPVILAFAFEGFVVSLFLEADIYKVGAEDSADFELVFNDPTASHLAPLRYILNSHLAGDLVTMGRFMEYAGPTQVKANAGQPKRTLMNRLRDGVRASLLVALSVGLVAVAANVVHQRLAFSYEARPVLIDQQGDTLRATAAGQITYADSNANAGDVVYSIGANTGSLLSVRMPCDCEIQPAPEFYEGATVLAGTPLVKLVAQDAELQASTQISYQGVARLLAGDQPELVFPDGRILPVLLDLADAADLPPNADVVTADIRIDPTDADTVTIGETAQLRFRRNLWPAVLASGPTN